MARKEWAGDSQFSALGVGKPHRTHTEFTDFGAAWQLLGGSPFFPCGVFAGGKKATKSCLRPYIWLQSTYQ